METLTLDGKRYLKAAEAAKSTGYTADYVGQLCRAGKIDSRLVGRTWYVHEDALGSHKRKKTRSNKKKTIQSFEEKLAVESEGELSLRDETRNAAIPAYRKRLLETKITYFPDDAEEVPYIKQAQLDVEESKIKTPKEADAKKVAIRVEKETKTKATTFSGVHKKAALSGSIEITDADTTVEEEDTPEVPQGAVKDVERTKDVDGGEEKSGFQKRLDQLGEGEDSSADEVTILKPKTQKNSVKSGDEKEEQSSLEGNSEVLRARGKKVTGKKIKKSKKSPSLTLILDAVPTTAAIVAVVLFVGSVTLQSVWVYDQGSLEDTIDSSLEVAAVLESLGINQ